ncbi:hypothetical protein [Catenulispora acidiphila]|uniref:hypothetical protein n=1 Tax=Catenulispora acidiphila TaxID=304895 RepID=UPI00117EAC3F|nr:hypothetical protein [Catenulispora acidiphila]
MSKEEVSEALEAVAAHRSELAGLGSLPDGLQETVLQMLPLGTRLALETYNLVDVSPVTSRSVQILRLNPLGKAVLKQLKKGDDPAPSSLDELLEEDADQEVALVGLTPVTVRVEQVRGWRDSVAEDSPFTEWQDVSEGPVPVAVEVGEELAATVVAHLALEKAGSTVVVWQESGLASVIDRRTGEPLPHRDRPLAIAALDETIEAVESRLAVAPNPSGSPSA